MQLWKAVEHASASQSTNSVWFIRYRASVATRYSLRISLTHDQSMELVNLTSEPCAIGRAILTADVAIPLVSANYLASQFIVEQELPAILESSKHGRTLTEL